MKSKDTKEKLKQGAWLGLVMLAVAPDYLFADQVTTFLSSFNSYLQNNIAPAMSLAGILLACCFIAFGKREGVMKGINAIAAGALAAGAVGIYSMFANWAK